MSDATPMAWMTPDGERTIPAHTKSAAEGDGGAILSSVAVFSIPLFATPPAPEVTDEMVEAGAMQMARHFAEKIPLTRHDDAALAKVRDSFRGEARRIIAAATAALNASKEGR